MNSIHWFCISNEFKKNQTDINYFKNYTITNVGIPRVSQCVQHTILYLIPAFFLLFFSPIVVYALHKCYNGPLHVKTPVTYRLFTTSFLFLNIIVQVGYYFTKWIIDSDEQEATLINGVKPLFRLYSLLLLAMSMLIAFSLQIASRKYGLVTSGVLFNYWLLLAICGAPQLYKSVENLMDQKNDLFIAVLFVIYYCVILLTLFISCFPDRPKSQILNSKVTPEYTVSFINNISFWWFNGMARLGNTRPLIMEDLWDLAKHDQSRHLVVKFEKIRACQCKTRDIKKSKIKLSNNNVEETELLPPNSQMDKAKKAEKSGETHNTKKIPSLIWALFLTFNHTVLGAFAYKLFYDLLQFAPPKLLDLLIQFMQDQNQSIWTGVGIALCMSVVYIVQSMILHQYFHTMFRLGMNVRSVLCSTVYKKALLLSSGARKNRTIGEIVNLMSVDIQRFQDMTTWIMYFWSAPLQVSLALFFLYRLLGLSVIAGLICLIAFIPFNAKISMAMRNYQQKQMALKDERLKLLNEMLSGIKVLKLYAWEKSIENRILAIRKKELDILKKEAYLHALSSMSWACAPFLVAVSTFTAYIIIDPANNILTPRITFVGISLFNILRFPLAIFSMVGSQAIQCAVSNKRLKVFLAEDEIQSVPNEIADHELAITLNDASFSWDQEENSALLLKGINLTIKKGSLVAIVGRIGAGKSSLFSAILGEMYRNSGTVSINGRVAYIPQQAWIQNMTFKENILFGNKFEQDKYECVLDACALRQDLSALPISDETEIGEKGINLSGGQKQRISLARAAYSDSDIYFLDDPLSAVDSHVGKHIFENLIDSENGMLRGKTRLLITHGLSFLKHCDQIILLKDGVISESGTYHDLLESSGEFSEIIKEYLLKDTANEISGQGNHELEEVEDLEQVQFKRSESCSKKGSDVDQLLNEKTGESSVKDVIPVIRHRKQHAKDQQQENGDVAQPLEVKDGTTLTSTMKNRGRIIEKEEVFTGKVKFSVYLSYLRAVGHEICIAFFLIYIGSSVLGVFCNLTLANWADHAKEIQTTDTLSSATISNLSIYTSLGMAQAISVSFGSILMAIGMIRASRILHNRMLRSTLRSPMSFFDVTPLGRIMNRFGKDVNSLDMDIPRSLSAFLRTILVSLETIIVITYSTPWFAVVILPLLIFYGFVLRYYVSTSRQLKRLDSTTRSPIYSHFQESVQGASSIRAYNCVDRFLMQSQKHVDYNAIAYYHSIVANRWLAVRLELVGNLIIFFSALSAVLFRGWDHVTAGLAGLSVSYALSVTQTLNWAVRMTSELETNIVSVERIDEYTITPNEAAMETPANLQLNERWPEKGEILFENLSLRYRPDLDLVLKGVTAEIHSKEKIGIIGRTGAGKSSLTLALFRIVEPSEGRILIDEIDIAKIGLYNLRSRITIVPQDPVLFTGTLRNNLDPFENYETADIWSALELTHMSEFVKELPERLDHKITESGENLSVGQRQLLCLARALLRQSKVLVLDEAAASVDIETDHLIQSTIREQFRDCTVLTIAHRLHSVLNSQRILVFSEGRVVEFDTPQNLFLQPNSMFRLLALDAGITSIDASNLHSGDELPNNNGLVETNKI